VSDLRLSVLDQVPIRQGATPEQALAESLELVALAEALGYHRYWFAEHHNAGSLACSTPEILIAAATARTRRIRVGSGGVMLTHYSPLKVAEVFRMLDALAPGRIDLGIGRAPGTDGRTARALGHGPGARGIEHFPEQLADLYGFLADDFPGDHPFHGIHAMPLGERVPEVWLLGSSTVSAQYAAEMGFSFSFAQFISPDGGDRLVRWYQEHFQPSPLFPTPRANLGVSVTCAETAEEALALSWSRWCWRIKHNRGLPSGGIPSVEEARTFPYTDAERDYIAFMRSRSIHGTPARVRDRLEQMAREYNVDEFVVLTITHDPAARRRSYALLANAFGLAPADAGGLEAEASRPR